MYKLVMIGDIWAAALAHLHVRTVSATGTRGEKELAHQLCNAILIGHVIDACNTVMVLAGHTVSKAKARAAADTASDRGHKVNAATAGAATGSKGKTVGSGKSMSGHRDVIYEADDARDESHDGMQWLKRHTLCMRSNAI